MPPISIHDTSIELDSPYLIEGLPGVGLVGKIATDLLIEQLEMSYYASVQCEGLPKIGVYHEGDVMVKPPVRIYADPENDLLALQSEVPVSGGGASAFASCVTTWMQKVDATPIYLSGHPSQLEDDERSVFGVATGDGAKLLDEAGIQRPTETGAISGPTGALLNRAAEIDLDSVGLIVDSDPQFPDPGAARELLRRGIEHITGIDTESDHLIEQAEKIRSQRQHLAERLQNAQADESTQARPIGMFQ